MLANVQVCRCADVQEVQRYRCAEVEEVQRFRMCTRRCRRYTQDVHEVLECTFIVHTGVQRRCAEVQKCRCRCMWKVRHPTLVLVVMESHPLFWILDGLSLESEQFWQLSDDSSI